MGHNLKPISKEIKLQVKMMLNAGKNQPEIAAQLGISNAKVNDIKFNKRNSKAARNSDPELCEIDTRLNQDNISIINNPEVIKINSNNQDNQDQAKETITTHQLTIQNKANYISQEYIDVIDKYKKSKEKIINNLETLILSAIEIKLLNKHELSSLEICQLTDKYLLLTGLKASLNSSDSNKQDLLKILQVNINK